MKKLKQTRVVKPSLASPYMGEGPGIHGLLVHVHASVNFEPPKVYVAI